MDDRAAIRANEEQKLHEWLAANEIASPEDLAFFFTSFEEALKEGRAVAEAWSRARGDTAPGLAMTARPLFRLAGQSAPAPSSSNQLPLPPSSSSYDKGQQGPALIGSHQILTILLGCMDRVFKAFQSAFISLSSVFGFQAFKVFLWVMMFLFFALFLEGVSVFLMFFLQGFFKVFLVFLCF